MKNYETGEGLRGKEHQKYLQRKTNENARTKQMRLKGTQEQNSFKVAREIEAADVRQRLDRHKGVAEVSQSIRKAEEIQEKVDKVNRRLTRIMERTEAIQGMNKKELLEYAKSYSPPIYATNSMSVEEVRTNIIKGHFSEEVL